MLYVAKNYRSYNGCSWQVIVENTENLIWTLAIFRDKRDAKKYKDSPEAIEHEKELLKDEAT